MNIWGWIATIVVLMIIGSYLGAFAVTITFGNSNDDNDESIDDEARKRLLQPLNHLTSIDLTEIYDGVNEIYIDEEDDDFVNFLQYINNIAERAYQKGLASAKTIATPNG